MDRLANTVRPYAWGSTTAIPELLGTEPTGEPQAELWMGAHPGAPSRLDRPDGQLPLDQAIAADPDGRLGKETTEKFGPRLPFLFKVLAAGAPLSLQVHPDLDQAKAGHADEESRGIPLDAPHRNYKDANHKPELICALTPFQGLCGFRRPAETADLLDALAVGALKPYADILRAARPAGEALREVFAAILTADRAATADTVAEAASAAAALADGPTPHATAYAAYADLAHHHPGDPGVLAAMLLNHVTLQPGEALYLGAGVPHAYLDGLGVELMANSDNVLRCGLTPKHVDVPELLKVTRFEPGDPAVLRPEADAGGEEVYDTPIDEFRLSRHVLAADGDPRRLSPRTPQILLCTEGHAELTGDGTLTLHRGQSAFVPAGETVTLTGQGTVFRATDVV
ncbi:MULTISPECIES: mannose-6-phosphate isomerase, class I [Streptomycetaceae]|uniref:Mannose-6-phosphate isomerase n=1 Tax=Streptantibioticus cattleyicolor (strain ATCC 35852 / DSM 46488 / JCM 4925 / NBRC 14057 / NRRL 8057) TaxID=1003195 RepID=F8JVA7_STREN|nr:MULTISPECIES: mannose-6-phosphate isomerase, class I [Streptomycetaceae]AEW94386.1 mannose-6-phosphate isomerase [Streptantibioticus cattleyicolor NRRL 8057 = DSM 46488]MYS59035.1 mannose-6-phosphate isomerase, class I [Streptomyces sp. SID5468]CCB74744.1 Mannose-6-phosphate isomerase [Streptantibioticus cattleyicolor NRRL 8057 = DSM 46488]